MKWVDLLMILMVLDCCVDLGPLGLYEDIDDARPRARDSCTSYATENTDYLTTTPASIENIRVYLVITISARVNIVCKRVAKVVKDVRAIDYQLSRLKDSLSEIKDKLAFIRRGITILIYNARLLDIELK
jgi:hypothetical protein